MVVKRITPLLLAASVLVCGFTGSFINIRPVHAITSVDELSDVSQSNWAYDALKDLVEKYNVVEGYPDKTFRGGKAPSRYEMAALLNATMKTIGKEIARLGAEKADKEDLATVAKLQEEFATELKTLQARSDVLEARATKIEAKNDEQDNRLAVMEKMKIYGDISFGGYGDIGGNPGDAFTDGISAVGRTRLNVDYAAVEDKGGPIVGPGTIHTRVVAAFGRVSPLESGIGLSTNRFSGASMIAGDASLYNEGFRTNDQINVTNGDLRTVGIGMVSGANLRSNAYIESAYYSQILKAGMPCMPESDNWRTSFDLRAGVMPWREIYFQSPYQGYENDQFQNTALINNPAILPNFTIPRVAVIMKQGLGQWANISAKVDGSFIDVSSMVDGVGLSTELDLGYNLGFIDKYFNTCDKFNLAGNIFGGYYLIKSGGGAFNNLVNVATNTPVIATNKGFDSTAHGFYAGMNQEIYNGIGLFGSFALNDTGPVSALLSALQNGTGVNTMLNNSSLATGGGASLVYGIRQAWTAGIEIPVSSLPKFLTFCKRQRDAMGVGVAFLFPNVAVGSPSNGISAANPNAGGREQVYEAYYKIQATDSLAFIPSVQIIQNRAAWTSNETNVLVGFRTSYKF